MELQDRVQGLLDRAVEQGLECGCQAAVYIDGKLEVNAYAGWTDWSKSRTVDENTLFPVYSTGKAPCSTSFHRLVEDGLVDYDTEVREFWPEYACNGKESMTVRHILSYRGGLYIQPKSTLKELADFKLMTERMRWQLHPQDRRIPTIPSHDIRLAGRGNDLPPVERLRLPGNLPEASRKTCQDGSFPLWGDASGTGEFRHDGSVAGWSILRSRRIGFPQHS